MGIWRALFRLTGWKIDCRVNLPDKCVICVAPHTSNLDFLLGLAAYESMGRKANFLMKKFWFFFPLKYLLKAFGGIPVDRKRRNRSQFSGRYGDKRPSLTSEIVKMFHDYSYLNLAVTPEGTRSANKDWKTGFIVIARDAGVPILLAGLDYKTKTIVFDSFLIPGSDIAADLREVKNFYSDKKDWAKYPNKFLTNE